ncbi:serologically defined colon cancer antigen 8 [Babesia caballi]|uniref:Serologically defined colon cancer antigen 8 n=1 Tax=Babesia caballi TaxID=5871 RepID=A0AAV4LYN3_BABCB|nr:serologically defined colon cancer antigen 8 [Babesia caballi]
MNFLKEFVDGILAEDDEQDVPRTGSYRSASGDARPENDGGLRHGDSAAKALEDVYREERRSCIATLLVRYGEGCVQQLNEMLKKNNETVASLAQRLDETYRSLGDFNNELEGLTQENVALRARNSELAHRVELLSSENVSLRSLLAQAETEAKSQEARIGSMADLLKDNAATFDGMKSRCAAAAETAAEIEALRSQLAMATAHIEALTKERDELVAAVPDAEHRIKEAVRRQDRAIAIAKLMAQQAALLAAERDRGATPPPSEVSHQDFAEARQQAAELRARVDQLGEENVRLKEVNEKLHDMFADLSKTSKQLKDSYLLEAIEALGKRHLKQLEPVQLIFIQPTRVLDLDLDLDFVRAEIAQAMQQGYPPGGAGVGSVGMQAAARPGRAGVGRAGAATFATAETQQSARGPGVGRTQSTAMKAPSGGKKDVWDDDWDMYDEILQEGGTAAAEAAEPPAAQQPQGQSPAQQPDRTPSLQTALGPHGKAAPAKKKDVWNDDLEDLLKDL